MEQKKDGQRHDKTKRIYNSTERRAYYREWRKKNPEKVSSYNRKYYKARKQEQLSELSDNFKMEGEE